MVPVMKTGLGTLGSNSTAMETTMSIGFFDHGRPGRRVLAHALTILALAGPIFAAAPAFAWRDHDRGPPPRGDDHYRPHHRHPHWQPRWDRSNHGPIRHFERRDFRPPMVSPFAYAPLPVPPPGYYAPPVMVAPQYGWGQFGRR